MVAAMLSLVGVGFLEAGGSRRSGMRAVRIAPVFRPAAQPVQTAQNPPSVWVVEQGPGFETYSNGLRIENRFATQNHPRSYLAFPLASGAAAGQRRSSPAGIVFHTTESLQARFEPGQNSVLQRTGEGLLEFVQHKKAYNFVIDRFGRIFRVVREEDAAEHAGYSVWADSESAYINLNESFIGIAVETRTDAGQTSPSVTPGQLRALATLTEMLRARFGIAAANCVTHAQVSVNPGRMLAGYHTDWASSFPFEAAGLPDNYSRPLPSVSLFGFQFDEAFAHVGGIRMAQSAAAADIDLKRRASETGQSPASYRQALQHRYRQLLSEIVG